MRADDIPAYLDAHRKKSDAMRWVSFPLKDRLEMTAGVWGFGDEPFDARRARQLGHRGDCRRDRVGGLPGAAARGGAVGVVNGLERNDSAGMDAHADVAQAGDSF